eukprot:g5803.t1
MVIEEEIPASPPKVRPVRLAGQANFCSVAEKLDESPPGMDEKNEDERVKRLKEKNDELDNLLKLYEAEKNESCTVCTVQ